MVHVFFFSYADGSEQKNIQWRLEIHLLTAMLRIFAVVDFFIDRKETRQCEFSLVIYYMQRGGVPKRVKVMLRNTKSL